MLMSTIVTPKLPLLDEHTAALDPATAEKVMAITNDIVHERNLTTLMITHNMGQALTTGTEPLCWIPVRLSSISRKKNASI